MSINSILRFNTRIINKLLARFSIHVGRIREGPPNPIQPWFSDPTFQSLWSRACEHTIVRIDRCYLLYTLALQTSSLAGEIAEVGVYRGGTAHILCSLFPRVPVHLFDTFQGMPKTDPRRDLHRPGDFSQTSIDMIRKYLANHRNALFHPGLFPNTAESVRANFKFIHVDADIYQSVFDSCAFFYPRLSVGGVLLFDDYGQLSCPGAKTAVDEYFADKPERVIYLPTGQAFITRLP